MDSDEREIIEYLKTWGENFISAKEICRRAGGKRRYAEDNTWAMPILQRLKSVNLIEGDELGRYRLKPASKKSLKARWISPDIEKILRESGVQIDAERADAAAEETRGQL